MLTCLFRFDFKNDFSEIRNELINKSQGDWILIADGHEYFSGIENIPWLILNTSNKISAFAFQLEMCPAEGGTLGQQIRLFKNDPKKNYWVGAVHNKLTVDNTAEGFATEMVKIYHDRSTKKRIERFSQRQDMVLNQFELELQKNPESPRAHYYLGTYYLSSSVEKDISGKIVALKNLKADPEKVKKSIYHLEKYLSLSNFYEEKYLAKWFMANAYFLLQDIDKTKQIAFDMFEQMPELPLAQGILGELYLDHYKQSDNKDQRLLALSEFWFKSSRSKKMPFVSCFFPKPYFTYLPWDRLTEIYSRDDKLLDAILCAKKTIEYPDYPEEQRYELLRCFNSWCDLYQQQTGIDLRKQQNFKTGFVNEDINSSRSGNRQFNNVHTVNTSGVTTL